MTQKTKKLICRIFGHKWERDAFGDIVTYEIVEYKRLNNGFPKRPNGKTKRRQKRKIVTLWKRCERCGIIKKKIPMNNEEKAKEFGIKYQTPCHGIGDCEFEASQAALEMAQWKDEQFKAEKQALIENACEWLKDNGRNYH